jgi:hypothetical protein
MDYLKLVNCPIRGLFPVKKPGQSIDWEAAGLNHPNITRDWVQGFDNVNKVNYVSLFSIHDADKLSSQNIVDRVNNNSNPSDTAEIIDQATYETLKATIEAVREQMQV